MHIYGIISEYNPFHNGHKYQIKKLRMNGASHIVAIMSGNIVQRGDIAVIDKHTRAQCAIDGGADLVIELPAPFSCASAELFAKGAVYILDSLNIIDAISFGSECGDIQTLNKAADAAMSISHDEEVSKLIADGISYPGAVSKILSQRFHSEISNVFEKPNNTLGIEYIKALRNINSSITPTTIMRKSVEHDSAQHNNDFASASLIRDLIHSKNDFSQFVPEMTLTTANNCIKKGEISAFKSIENIVLYKIASMTHKELQVVPDMGGGLCDRIYNASQKASTVDELFTLTKTKCFTLARIRRAVMYALLGITKADFDIMPPYARILAFNDKGCELLSMMKDKCTIPFSTSLAELSKASPSAQRFAQIDELASALFSLSVENKTYKKNEYSVMIKKS